MVSSLQDLQTIAVYVASSDLEMHLHERIRMIEAVEESQAAQRVDLGRALMDMMSIDESDAVYQSCRSKTTTGLAVASLIAGGYGAVKGVIGFSKWTRAPVEVSKVLKSIRETETFVNRGASLAGNKRFPLTYPPYQEIRNRAAIIDGRRYTGHALDRMQDRGFMPSVIENTVNAGHGSPTGFPGGLEYYDTVNKVKVIVGENGQIITIIPGRQ